MLWDSGDIEDRIEELRRDQRAQVALSEEAMTTELAALATVDRARAVMRHCADCIRSDADEIDRLLDEIPPAREPGE